MTPQTQTIPMRGADYRVTFTNGDVIEDFAIIRHDTKYEGRVGAAREHAMRRANGRTILAFEFLDAVNNQPKTTNDDQA
jgi:hypothetical protein